MSCRIGVDIGGTFTDIAVVDAESGEISVVKRLTTPREIAAGVLDGLAIAMERHEIEASTVTLLSHATTVVTNALLEQKGARVALIATRGFRDLLELRRSSRSHLYDLFQDPPAVLVPRRHRYEITERIAADGSVIKPLAEDELDAIVGELRAAGVEAVAVALLFSFQNDIHERLIGEHLRAALPGVPIFLSSEVLPEVREFERTSTTAVCAYVGPILTSYLQRLEEATGGLDLPPLHVMGSSGGVVDVQECLSMPAMAVESGPAAGVIAANFIGRQLGLPNLITFDMGGTTAKASLIHDGDIAVTSEYEVGSDGNVGRWMHGTGHPIRVPVIDLAEVSAGGGSIAWIDAGGALRVGPQSAGAEPGPVCYGRGGTAPTISDCNLVLGYLNPTYLLGGELPVDLEAARQAIETQLAIPLGQTVEQAAASVIAIVNHNMADALRIVSVERGYDAREFTLVAFGGAGPLHAASLARALGMGRIIVPPIPGGFSALGLVAADLQRDYGRTFYSRLQDAKPDDINAAFVEMEAAGQTMLAKAGIAQTDRVLARSADLRYARQAYELNIPLEDGTIDEESLSLWAEAFHARHRQTYGHDNPSEPVQVVNLRLSAIGRMAGLTLRQGRSPAAEGASVIARRQVWFEDHGPQTTQIYASAALRDNETIEGPAVVEASDTTIVVPPAWRIQCDGRGFLMMEAMDRG